jgi:hypothetical protein
MVVIFPTTLHGHTFQKTILGKLVNYEVHNLYTPHLILFIIYGVISNDLYHYLGLRSFIFGKLRVPVATSRPAIVTKLLTILLSPSRKVLAQYLDLATTASCHTHVFYIHHSQSLYHLKPYNLTD